MRGGAYARIVQYLLVIVVEWLMVAFIWYFVRRRGIRIGDLVGGRWARPVDALRDLGIAVAFLIISGAILQGLGYLLKAAPNAAIRNVLPRGPSEMILWIMVSLTAGFCEELIFRGYLQRQFAALTRSAVGGIVLQGIAFGAGHGYQGWRLMVLISVFGAMFGLLAHWCRSLRPGMIGHFLQDGVGGIVGRHLMR
jgi:membrane protease YdiL (CAAX protease family)